MRSLTPRRSKMVQRNIRLILHLNALIREGNPKQQAFSNSNAPSHKSICKPLLKSIRYEHPDQKTCPDKFQRD